MHHGPIHFFICTFLMAGLGHSQDYRLPSKIWENVGIMRNTDFKANAKFIDIEDDIMEYIRYELERIEVNSPNLTGDEIYYLGLLYFELGRMTVSIRYLKEYVEKGAGTSNSKNLANGRGFLAKALIKTKKLKEAARHIRILEREDVPYIELLKMEMAKEYAKEGDRENALSYARKAIRSVENDSIGLFLDPIISHFICARMDDNAKKLVDEILTSVEYSLNDASKDFIITRRKQLSMLGKKSSFDVKAEKYRWVGITPPPPSTVDFSNKVVMIYFWASWCAPCRFFFLEMDNWLEKYGDKGLKILGITRLYGEVFGVETKESLTKDQEIKHLNDFCTSSGIPFPSIVDEFHILGDSIYMRDVPFLILLDRKGTFRLFLEGGNIEKELLEGMIKEMLEESGDLDGKN